MTAGPYHPDPPKLEKAYTIWLHGELSLLHELLARRSIPHSYSAEGCEPVAEVMQFLEGLTGKLPV